MRSQCKHHKDSYTASNKVSGFKGLASVAQKCGSVYKSSTHGDTAITLRPTLDNHYSLYNLCPLLSMRDYTDAARCKLLCAQ
jgi:hypothetical protein